MSKSPWWSSSFLLALAEELHKSRSDVCVLMYDGASLRVEPSVTGVISQDFDSRLIVAGQRVQWAWREIAKIEEIDERLVVLCIDAINENPQAKELLRQLDELVQEPWPWLRVVISSRPETWQVIKRGVKLAEALYYREEGSETLGVELEPFSYAESKMEPFSRQELPAVYAKYQQIFGLQTHYEALRGELREILREPLNLLLVARIYAGEAIPDTLRITELIKQYVDALLRSERLREEDLRFLERQLVPLMVTEGRYSNAITIANIDAAGGGLYEAIYSGQVLSDGRRVNQSFVNLLDAEILVEPGEGREHVIAFKHKHFYDYFAGRRIFELSGAHADRPAFFADLISTTTEVAFLWDAVKSALVQDTQARGPETILGLCSTEQQRVKEMMINVLIDFGHDNRTEVQYILKELVAREHKAGILQSIRQLFDRSTTAADVRARNAREIAFEVATHLDISLDSTNKDVTGGFND